MERKADLVLTVGDPRGIGPEVSQKALEALPGVSDRVLVLGPSELRDRFQRFEAVDDLEPASGPPITVDFSPANRIPPTTHPGRIAGAAIERGIALAMKGEVGGLVTGPIHKPALQEAGFAFPGHTEMLQARCGVPAVGMLMAREAHPPLRVLLATTHLALRDVAARLTQDLLIRQTSLLVESLKRDWGMKTPRVALCAFNPHASDNGLFGDEEASVYAPALESLADLEASVTGPVPADTVFVRALRGEFDAVVAPYHDVGMAGFKTATFGGGVNVTLGLPFIRTSPDHGTAFDIAGQGVADPSSTQQAITLALKLVAARRQAVGSHG